MDLVETYLQELFGNKTASLLKRWARIQWSKCMGNAKEQGLTYPQSKVSCYSLWYALLNKMTVECKKDKNPEECLKSLKKEIDMIKLTVHGAIDDVTGKRKGTYIMRKK
jgi:hypothetical protein